MVALCHSEWGLWDYFVFIASCPKRKKWCKVFGDYFEETTLQSAKGKTHDQLCIHLASLDIASLLNFSL
jgi:hypothetical protein